MQALSAYRLWADAQAELEAAAIDKAEAEKDTDLEI